MTAFRHISFRSPLLGALAVGLMLFLSCFTAVPYGEAQELVFEDTSILTVRQFEIETLEATYKVAEKNLSEAGELMAENQARIDELEAELPEQQRKVDKAFRDYYIMEGNKLYYLDFVLKAETFNDFVQEVEFLQRASKDNLEELNKLKDMMAELEEARAALEAAKARMDEEAERARSALVALQDERAAKQAGGQAHALSQDGSSVLIDGADWYMTEDEFIAEWAPRINAYFEGTPMAGTGETFALMSFRYCIDPRWSPAISNTESGKGRICIRPYNAWGWGAADSDPYNLAFEWGSWDEAIEAHISGLARGYGYTISKSAAKSYCSTPDSWYANTLSEMARI